MATLTGKTIASTYKDLLQVSNSNSGIDGTKRAVSDGEATASPLELSSSAVNISSGFELGGSEVTASATELNVLDDVTAGTVTASKAVVVDANKDIAGIRNLIISGGISAKPFYGVAWNESADSYVRTGALTGVANSASPSEFMAVHAGIKRCLLADDGGVNYFLDASDSTLKSDGTASDLTGTDGQVMVQIPKFWYKYGYSGTTHTWEIASIPIDGFEVHPAFLKNGAEVDYRYIGAYEGSMYDASATGMVASGSIATNMYASGDKLCSLSGEYPKTNETRAEFRAMGTARGTGWRQLDYDLASAVQLLYLVEYADFDSQSTIGEGRTQLSGGSWTAGSYIGQCGKSNGDGNGTNNVEGNTNNAYMTYRGIENFFGNIWKFVDGININDNVPYVSNNDANWADDTATNYTDLGVTLHNGDGYQGTLEQINRGFLPASLTGGSSSAKITDYYYQNTGWRVFRLGGDAVSGSNAGVFYVIANDASSDSHVRIASRVCY